MGDKDVAESQLGGLVDDRAVEVGILEFGVLEAGAPQVRAGEVGAVENLPEEVLAAEVLARVVLSLPWRAVIGNGCLHDPVGRPVADVERSGPRRWAPWRDRWGRC